MSDGERRRKLGRADRVLPGAWRLRLPLPWPGVPHVNAWALSAGDGIVLVDTGIHEEGALAELERTLAQIGRRLEDVRLLVCTHAHSDHYGLAAPIVERAGCELWMHPRHQHMTKAMEDPERSLAQRIEVARQSGVPLEPLRRWAEERRRDLKPSIAGVIEPHRELLPGVEVETDHGTWSVHYTPGHAPSHVVLHQPEQRLLLSGDHVLGRVFLYFDYGWTPDPVGEFLDGLDAVERLDARLCLPGHGRPFGDIPGHIEANRAEVHARLDAIAEAIAEHDGEASAFDLVRKVFGEVDGMMMSWALTVMLCFLTHLERAGQVERVSPPDAQSPERWRSPAPTAVLP
ncbi:MAG TPA: MBL fold metallo-hydrolase [Solirubrobacterales bacterium]|nr:MBL fold metallo-hydrolase [Solirubrobacterales bacterium]